MQSACRALGRTATLAVILTVIPVGDLVYGAGAPINLTSISGPALPATPGVRAYLFVCHDCPISTAYMPEIQRITDTYAAKGVSLCVVLEDAGMGIIPRCPVVLDGNHALARRLQPQVTPEAVIIGTDDAVLYRGRIDDTWAALGRSRARATSHDLCDALDAVLAGTPIKQPVARAIGCIIDLDDKVTR
jgi:hypothetical protein